MAHLHAQTHDSSCPTNLADAAYTASEQASTTQSTKSNLPNPSTLQFGTPYGEHAVRVLLLGSGELGKEITLELMRLGAWICAADSYEHAPAHQVAHEARVLNMADPDQLNALIAEIQPNIIIPEVEAIATDQLAAAAQSGIQVVPSCQAAQICMDREALRRLAAETLGLPTSPYRFAGSFEEFQAGVQAVGFPCVVKPVMSSSGHGQAVMRSEADIEQAWHTAQTGGRVAQEGHTSRVVIEGFVNIVEELTILTISSSAGIVACAPIGQRQDHGDYRESWQPAQINQAVRDQAADFARQIVQGLTDVARAHGERGWGVYGVELFVLDDGSVLFNEVSPRPHDTGMVTMISQHFSEFALHARAVLGIPVTEASVALRNSELIGVSHAMVIEGEGEATFSNLPQALATDYTDIRIFSKPQVHGHRRMAVVLAADTTVERARAKADAFAQELEVTVTPAQSK